MAIDDRNKRVSAMTIAGGQMGMPNPDGSVDDADRADKGQVYAGLNYGPPVVVQVINFRYPEVIDTVRSPGRLTTTMRQTADERAF